MVKQTTVLLLIAGAGAAVGIGTYYKVTHPIGPPNFQINGQAGVISIPANVNSVTVTGGNFVSYATVQFWGSGTAPPPSGPSATNGQLSTIGNADFWGNITKMTGGTGGSPGQTFYSALLDVNSGLYSNVIQTNLT